ncbi:unnamed protein product [Cylicocyclus nassatus]|uniref:UPAR/Ly6 domain-containing protein n=1 Tax=Cylicocyclus nassatus TaxID=53992 RepID=A0AA36H934_CYLNA|nr:unnamed protein product [Cylicocyclus nassatus]
MLQSRVLSSQAMLHAVYITLLSPALSNLLDCTHGFVGRKQDGPDVEFVSVNDTRICAAHLCIKVIVHAGTDAKGVLRQGISSRCGYTGGDRSTCSRIEGCSSIPFYDGMTGNFSFCCCYADYCNAGSLDELEGIYATNIGNSPIGFAYGLYTVLTLATLIQ